MDFLDVLRGRLRAALDQRAAVDAELDNLVQGAEAEERDLNEAEASQFSELRSRLTTIDTDRAQLEARIAELEQIRARRSDAEATAASLNTQMGRPTATPVTHVGNEPRTYTLEGERRGVSFLRDLVTRNDDPAAAARLVRHQAEARADYAGTEYRDLTASGFSAGLTIPLYLSDMLAPLRRAGRPVADICNQHPLPPSGMAMNIPKITGGTSVDVQPAELATVADVDLTDAVISVPVRTVAGMQDVSRQALDRSEGIESLVLQDLLLAYNARLDWEVLNGSGTGGHHKGILRTSGLTGPVAYTDASPTAAELYPKLADLIQQIQTAIFFGVTHFIMHPRRWWWLASQVGTTFPFLNANEATVQAGRITGTDPNATGRLMGVPVVMDPQMPTTWSSGAYSLAGTEDVILGVTSPELHLWEDPSAPLMIRAEQPLAHQLAVRFVLYGYSAFTAERYPTAHGTITGTGLVTPTF